MPTPHYGQPRYRTIADELRKRIKTEAIRPGTLLPPEATLTAEFQASRGTIRQAIGVLREEGLVATEHGRGSFAVRRTNPVSNSHHATQQKIPADARLAGLLNVDIGTILVEHESVTLANDRVDSVVRVYRPASPAAIKPASNASTSDNSNPP
ncbi:GntR family transcriptional regulator [Micromonospora sp. WMMD723]|uniref:GntR family transcriptional regulator n=1 Tax=Micromonospora sp. WMMD723 TaxID=3403465 RepID=UPI003CF3D58F